MNAVALVKGKGSVNVSEAVQKDGQVAIFQFSVPLWGGGQYPNWGQAEGDHDKVDLTAFQVQATFDDIKKGNVPPASAPLSLPLPASVLFQAWTLAHPLLSVVGLLVLGLGVVVATRWRRLLAGLAPRPEAVDSNAVGEYRLHSKIGEGGMGEVWAATSVSELKCALKFVRKELADDEDFKKRFEREIKACLPLSHPHMLKLYGYGVAADGRMYTVSELLVGKTLKETIKSGDFDPPQLASQVLEQVGDALSYLHDRGLIHRDVKPDNIFVCEDGSMKLMDMGLIHGEALTVVTRTGFMMGTPAYMPPEQMDAKRACGASDQYSLGIILYEILAGQRPFTQPDAILLAYQHLHVAPPSPRELEERITPEIEASVLRMLAKKPEQRFANLAEAQAAMEPLSFTSWPDRSRRSS